MKENVENFRCEVCGGTDARVIAGYAVCNTCGNAVKLSTDEERKEKQTMRACGYLVDLAKKFGLDAEAKPGIKGRYILRKVGQESPAFIVSLEEPMEIFQRKCERLKGG